MYNLLYLIYNKLLNQTVTTQPPRRAMKMENSNLKNKVIKKLIKWGNNENNVIKMVELHFDYASKQYSTVTAICECIRTIY